MLFPLPACIQVLNGGVIQREATYPQEQSSGSEIIPGGGAGSKTERS